MKLADEEKPLDLRDKLALEILNGLLAGDPCYQGHTGTAATIMGYTHPSASDFEKKWGNENMTNLVRTAYKIADTMRKIRLEVFS